MTPGSRTLCEKEQQMTEQPFFFFRSAQSEGGSVKVTARIQVDARDPHVLMLRAIQDYILNT